MSIFGRLAALVPGGQVVAVGSFIADHWKEIVLVVAVCAWTGAAYWAGGRGPRADLAAFQAKVVAERAQQEVEDAADEAASQEFVVNLDREHNERLKSVAALWGAELDRVRNESSGKPAPKPVQPTPRVCSDAAGNQRLSDALAEYREELRAIVADERSAARTGRAEAGRLLAVCQRQAGDLAEVNRWAEHEQQLWGEAGQPAVLH